MSDPYALILAGAALLTALSVIWKYLGKPLLIIIRKTEKFLEDWNGEPARPGFKARPGAMERLAAVEFQLVPNHGSSMRDAINRTETKLDDHIEQCNATSDLARAMPIVAASQPPDTAA